MPKVGQSKKNGSSFDTIEAPSTGMLDNNRLREELFHLERAVSRSTDYNQTTQDAIDDLTASIDKLTEVVETQEETLKAIETLLCKVVKQHAEDS